MNVFKELIIYRDLLWNLTSKELKLKYKNSVVGFLWSFLNPLMMLVIYSLAFKIIIRVNIENFSLFVFIGLLPWMFVQAAITQSTNSVINNQNLVKKVYFPRIIIPLSVVLSNFISFLINYLILFIVFFFYHIQFHSVLILLPVIFFANLLFVTGVSIFLSSVTVKYRDISHLVEVLFMGWFYLTPIIYSSSMVPEKFRIFIDMNPLTSIINTYRSILFEGIWPDFTQVFFIVLFSLVICLLGVFVFQRRENLLADEL
jgi:ABC-type polysaccharide/polyol phosphate export permease